MRRSRECEKAPSRVLGPRDGKLISLAESKLGLRFPAAYRVFVQQLGAGSFGAAEFYGLIDSDFEHTAPDAVWATLDHRTRGLPTNLIVVGYTGDGGSYVVDAAGPTTGRVFIWWPGAGLEPVADDFGVFLRRGVDEEVDRRLSRGL